MFAFYEKPRMATLNQEMIRRMVDTSENVGDEERCEIVDKYATKLVNSEYSIVTTRKIIAGGQGYERMLSGSKHRMSQVGSHFICQLTLSPRREEQQKCWQKPTGSRAGKNRVRMSSRNQCLLMEGE